MTLNMGSVEKLRQEQASENAFVHLAPGAKSIRQKSANGQNAPTVTARAGRTIMPTIPFEQHLTTFALLWDKDPLETAFATRFGFQT